jgi:hypothetical protein
MVHQRGVTTLSVLSGLGTDPYQPQPVAPPSLAARAGFVAACVLGAGALWWATRSVAPKKNRRRSGRVRRNPKLVGNAKFSELGTFGAVAKVRDAAPREQLGFMPPGLVKKLRSLPPGIYKYGHGSKKGEAITRFSKASLKGAITSTRIGARAVAEHHWVIDNYDPKYPVVIRVINDKGKTTFRVEEYAKQFASERVAVRRRGA